MSGCSKQCGICDEEYDSLTKKPSMLPCGHSYCLPCLQQVENTACSKSCPFCRSIWSSEVHELPVCYQLVPDETADAGSGHKHKSQEIAICEDHNFMFSFWCKTCEVDTCKMCVIVDHKSCDLILLEDAKKPLKSKFQKAYAEIKNDLSIQQENLKSCIDTNNERMSTIQKFMKVIKKFETELGSHQKELVTQATDLESDLGILEKDPTPICSPEQIIESVLEKRTIFYKLQKSNKKLKEEKLLPLCNIASTFLDLGDEEQNPSTFISKFCQTQLQFQPSNTWLISDDAASVGAIQTIIELQTRPNTVVVRSTNCKPLKSLEILLPFLAKETNDLHVELMDSFWFKKCNQTTAVNADSDSLRVPLASLNLNNLKHFFGFLDCTSIQKLTVTVIGFALYKAQDLQTLNGYYLSKPNLRELHLSVIQTVEAQNIPALHADFYINKTFYLHFPYLTDDKITWMMQVVAKLIPLTTINERIYSLCLPECCLSTGGLELLLGLVHGCQMTGDVWLAGSCLEYLNIHKLKKQFIGYGVTLRTEQSFRV